MQFDLSDWPGVIAAAVALFELAKRVLPTDWWRGKERWWNLGVVVILAVVSKLIGYGFQEASWEAMILHVLGMATAAGAAYEGLARAIVPKGDQIAEKRNGTKKKAA